MALIVFYRHGKAEPRREGVSDRERRLTREGVMQVECGGRLLLGAGFKKILSSPYRRAVETAEILARTLKLSYAIADWLAPDSGVGLEDLEKFGVDDGVILVGHNPWMEETIIELVGGALELKAGGFAVVSVIAFRPGGGNLLSLVNPGVVNVCKGGGRA